MDLSADRGRRGPALIFSLLWLFGIGSLVAIALDHGALRDIRGSRGWLRGEGIAIVALVFGYSGLATALLVILIAAVGP